MKRFLLVFLPILILGISLIFSQNNLSVVLKNEAACGSIVKDYLISDLGFVREINEGNYISYEEGGVVVGECVFLNKSKCNLNKICDKLGLNIHKNYYVGDKHIIEGSSAIVRHFSKTSQNNVQIAVLKDKIIIGSPMIYGSY